MNYEMLNPNKVKSETKKKSLAEIVDEVIIEKESIYFNPDNKPLSAKEHNFEGETPIFHSRATYDPYDIAPAKNRLTSSNNFEFKEKWDTAKREEDQNLTFGSTQKMHRKFDFEPQSRFSRFTPEKEADISRNNFVPDYNTNIDIEKSYKPERKPKKNISKLSEMSNTYYDDSDRKVMQRYYLLIHGEPTAIHFQFSAKIFKKSDYEMTNARASFLIRNINCEFTNDLAMNFAK